MVQPAAYLTQMQPLMEHHVWGRVLEQAVQHQRYRTAREGYNSSHSRAIARVLGFGARE